MKKEKDLTDHGFSTGEVSKKYNISVKSLRYYDDIDLLKPSKRNATSGYRYYTFEDIAKLMTIKYYQELGISLDKIKEFFIPATLEEKAELFRNYGLQIERDLQEKLMQQENFIAWKNLVEEGAQYQKQKIIPYRLKKVRLMNTLAVGNVFIGREMKSRNTLRQSTIDTGQYTYGPAFLEFQSYQDILLKKEQVCFRHMEINPRCFAGKDYSQLGGFFAVSGIHLGDLDSIENTYKKLADWAKTQQIPLRGDAVERLIIDLSTTENPDDFVTEILLPIVEETE